MNLPAGDVLIGRGAACELQIDDHLVSRRHALIRTTPAGASIEDAGSRNGVFVNGSLVNGPMPLAPGDVIRIGDSELVFSSAPPTGHETLPEMKPFGSVAIRERDDQTLRDLDQAPTSPSAVLLELADKALTLGKPEDAEWVLTKLAEDIDQRLASGQSVSSDTIEQTALRAIKTARARGEGRWLEWIFDVHRRRGKVLPAALIDELHPAFRQLRFPASTALTRYLESLREGAASRSPSERFLVQRVEGLLAVAASGYQPT